MATFTSLTQTETNEHFKNVFGIIAKHESSSTETEDGYKEIALDAGELALIRDEMYQEVHDSLVNDASVQSASELKASMLLKTKDKLEAFFNEQQNLKALKNNPGITQDGYFNSTSGIGTYIDPGMDTQSFIPVSITPSEATSYYANGGVPARIIDKKAGCLSLDGIKFECSSLSADDLKELEDYAVKCGFDQAYSQGITQSLIFGGAAIYPSLTGDNPIRTQMSLKQILQDLPEKDFINYWITADRWNCIFIPEYNITAQDYLFARSLFIPLGGYRVNTDRMAMIRPSKLPFWGAIKQMGWSTSDFEGWIKDYESYEIMKMSLPIMAQQMSLMYHSIPADGIIIENGPEYAKAFFKQNEKEMREWSILHPKAINSVGDIKVIERTYSGFQQLISEARLALCSSARVPESILFAEKSTGLASDNEMDVTLKQSETIRLLFNNIAPSFKNCIQLLVYSCFGKNSEQAKYARDVKIKADDGVVLSESDKAQMGATFAQIASSFAGMGLDVKTAINIAQKCVPSVELDKSIIKELEEDGEGNGMDVDLWKAINEGGINDKNI